jgi:hypothetical protein
MREKDDVVNRLLLLLNLPLALVILVLQAEQSVMSHAHAMVIISDLDKKILEQIGI